MADHSFNKRSFHLKLGTAPSFRIFLNTWMQNGSASGKSVSFAQVAKRMGLRSRSFVSDVIHGHKNLSARSLKSLSDLLNENLPGDLVRYFEYLVYAEIPVLRPNSLSLKKIETQLKNLCQQNSKTYGTADAPRSDALSSILTDPLFHWCYAALGLSDKGNSAAEVARKTGIPKDQAAAILSSMVSSGFAKETNGKFVACDAHRILAELGDEPLFRSFISNWLAQIQKQIESRPPRGRDLFNLSTLSMRKAEILKFKKKLTSSIDAAIEEFESADGDVIVSLTVLSMDNSD